MSDQQEKTPARGVYIDGAWRPGTRRVTRTNRWTGEALAQIEVGGKEQARAAVDAAARALATGLPASERSAVLERVADAVERDTELFAQDISRESGKPISAARVEVGRAVGTLRYASEEARRLPGERVPLEASAAGDGTLALTVPHPRGVVAAITPFNFPLNLVAHKVGPALAAGCPVVLKPASVAGLVAVRLVETFERQGLPAGWLNLVNGPGAEVVDAWMDDDRVAVVNFTGSAAVGWSLKARSPRKLHILELGSSTAMYVHSAADLERAARDAVAAGFANSGQACISLQRLFVDDAVKDELVGHLTRAVAAVPAGDPSDERTVVGPLVTDGDAERVASWVDAAVAGGARVLVGGGHDHRSVAPTLVADPPADSALVSDEVFGPVVSVIGVRDLEDAIARVNDSRFGLNTSVYTADLATALAFADRVESGTVLVNVPPSFRADFMPYGGVKESGQGREGVRFAISELVEMKLVIIKS